MSPRALAQAEARPGAERPPEPRAFALERQLHRLDEPGRPGRARGIAPGQVRQLVGDDRPQLALGQHPEQRQPDDQGPRPAPGHHAAARQVSQADLAGRLDSQPAPDRPRSSRTIAARRPGPAPGRGRCRGRGSPPGTTGPPARPRPPTSPRSRCGARPASPARTRRRRASPARRRACRPSRAARSAGASSSATPASARPAAPRAAARGLRRGPPRGTRPHASDGDRAAASRAPRVRPPRAPGPVGPRAPPRIRGTAARAKLRPQLGPCPVSAPRGPAATPDECRESDNATRQSISEILRRTDWATGRGRRSVRDLRPSRPGSRHRGGEGSRSRRGPTSCSIFEIELPGRQGMRTFERTGLHGVRSDPAATSSGRVAASCTVVMPICTHSSRSSSPGVIRSRRPDLEATAPMPVGASPGRMPERRNDPREASRFAPRAVQMERVDRDTTLYAARRFILSPQRVGQDRSLVHSSEEEGTMSTMSRSERARRDRRSGKATRRRRRVAIIPDVVQQLEDRRLLSLYTVTSLADDGSSGTLRSIIQQVNNDTSPDTIDFNLPGSAPYVIQPTSALPAITNSVTIDGTSQPGYSGTPDRRAQRQPGRRRQRRARARTPATSRSRGWSSTSSLTTASRSRAATAT